MSAHVFKSSFGQCNCRWCGAGRHADSTCRVPEELRAALKAWAKDNGRTWRRKLLDAWMRGDDVGQQLQLLRNIIGPSGLLKIPARLVVS